MVFTNGQMLLDQAVKNHFGFNLLTLCTGFMKDWIWFAYALDSCYLSLLISILLT